MLALYRCGRQAEGLEVYQETRKLLNDQLGLEPESSYESSSGPYSLRTRS